MDHSFMATALPVHQGAFHNQTFGRSHPFVTSDNLDNVFPTVSVASSAGPLSSVRSSVAYFPQNHSHERNTISHVPPYGHQPRQSIYESPVPSVILQGQPLFTASQPSSPYESRSSSISAGRPAIRPGTDSPVSNSLSSARAFSVTSQPVESFSVIEDEYMRPPTNSMQHHYQQQLQPRNEQSDVLRASGTGTQDGGPARVVGKQGVRGILPSAKAGVLLSPGKTQQVLAKDENGKYPCLHCQKTYLHAKHLKRHLLRHLGIRPYACYLCRDTFSRSDILKRHFQKCSQRRGNPGGQDHLAEKRRKNRSYSTADESWRSISRSASGSGETSYNKSIGFTGSLLSATNTTGALRAKSSLQSQSTPSSMRSSSTTRIENGLEAGRSMSSAEFLIQQQQRQQQDPPTRGRMGYRSVSAIDDLSFPTTLAATSKSTLAESLAAYSLPKEQYNHDKRAITEAYCFNSPDLDCNDTKNLNGSTSYEYAKDPSRANRQMIGLQPIAETVSWTGSGFRRDGVSNANGDENQGIKESRNNPSSNAQQEQAQQRYQQQRFHQQDNLDRADTSTRNTDGDAATPRTGSPYRLDSVTHVTPSPLNDEIPNALLNDVERRSAWPSISSQDYGSTVDGLLSSRRHTLQPQHYLNYYNEYQPQQQQQQQQQQQHHYHHHHHQPQRHQQQQLGTDQHQFYQQLPYPYELNSHSQSNMQNLGQKREF